jgi:outer membrane protein assembly factor BamD (BamD/ComL family)
MNLIKLSIFCALISSFVFQITASADESSQFVISAKTAEMQISQAETAYKAGNLKEAHAIVSKLRPSLSEATELHSQLYNALKDEAAAAITADGEKKQTIEFAKLRDKANYLSGMISLKSGNQREAVKHLVQVVESQRTTELGEKAYNTLREMGFSSKLNIREQ